MTINQKVTGKALSLPEGLAWGGGVSLGITILGSGILAKLVDMEVLPWERIGYGVMVMILVAAFIGAIIAYGKVKRQRLTVSCLSGAVYWALLLGMTALFFGGQYEAVGVTGALVLAGSGCAGLLGLRQKRGGRRTKIR